jgi:hypothetical protein
MSKRTLMSVVVPVVGLVLAGAGPAAAAHPHYVMTPNGKCHAVAGGQTAISDPAHGGEHRFHHNVHLGAGSDGTLGSSGVAVAKGVCP